MQLYFLKRLTVTDSSIFINGYIQKQHSIVSALSLQNEERKLQLVTTN